MSLGKKWASLLVFLCLFTGSVQTRSAEFFPKDIRLVTPESHYEAGTVQDIGIVRSDIKGRANLIFDYGIARAITKETVTSYEIITTNTSNNTNQLKFSVPIPNTVAEYASSSFVAYLKSYVPNRPETQNFFVTKQFTIDRNEGPYAFIKHVNLVREDGARASLMSGPIIYRPDPASVEPPKPIRISLEMTFETDREMIVSPVMKFRKLRSNNQLPDYTPNTISLAKGDTTVVIPLPIFDYKPGTYIGEVLFQNDLLPVHEYFQYTIAGESASVGLVTSQGNGVIRFNIFGTPIDINQPIASSSKELYTLKANFISNGKEVFSTTTENVDFNSGLMDILLPGFVKEIDSVYVEVISPRDGKVLFSDTKGVVYSKGKHGYSWPMYYILIMVILIACAYKKHKIKFIIALLALCALIFAQRVYGDIYVPDQFMSANYNAYNNGVSLYVNQSIGSLIQTCNQPISLLYGVYYNTAASSYDGNTVGFSVLSASDADAKQEEMVSVIDTDFSRKPHVEWKNIANWYMYQSPTPVTMAKNVYVTLKSNFGIARYKFPMSVGECYACTNASGTSNIPNFQKFGRNYYFSTTTGLLYAKNIQDSDVPSECKIDMCSNTETLEDSHPDQLTWSPFPGTYSADPDRYACIQTRVQCGCSNRNMVCKNDVTGTSTTSFNDSACKFQAFCTVTQDEKGGGKVVFDAYNKVGTVIYDNTLQTAGYDAKGAYSLNLIPEQGKLVTNTLTDSFDGSISTAACSLVHTASSTSPQSQN